MCYREIGLSAGKVSQYRVDGRDSGIGGIRGDDFDFLFSPGSRAVDLLRLVGIVFVVLEK